MFRKSLWFLALVASLAVALVVSQAPRPATVAAQGVDELGAEQLANYVTDDMLINADKDPNNWLHYGRDYQSSRYSPLQAINVDNAKKLVPSLGPGGLIIINLSGRGDKDCDQVAQRMGVSL